MYSESDHVVMKTKKERSYCICDYVGECIGNGDGDGDGGGYHFANGKRMAVL